MKRHPPKIDEQAEQNVGPDRESLLSCLKSSSRLSRRDEPECTIDTTKRTWLLTFTVLFALVSVAIVYVLASNYEVPVNESLYDRLALGMTSQQVDLAVGHAPGDYSRAYIYTTTEPKHQGEMTLLGTDACDYSKGRVSAPHPVTGKQISGKLWKGKRGVLMVFFGDDDRVIERRFYPGYGQSWLLYHLERVMR